MADERLFALAVTLLRPSKIKWKLGSFGAFTPAERIYAASMNLCRMGASSANYISGVRRTDPLDCIPISASQTVTAHAASSSMSYVTETDVAAVANPKATCERMMADLYREATPVFYQATTAATPKTGSAETTITPGADGSIIMAIEGQGYELDVIGDVGGSDYIAATMNPKTAMTADGVNNQWGHVWPGKVPIWLPIDGSMDGNTFAWSLKAYSAFATYQGFMNAWVYDLPADWDTDE